MTKALWLTVLLLMLLPFPLSAETLQVAPGVSLEFSLPSERWTVAHEAPRFLLEETAEHLDHELAAQGKKLDDVALQTAARKRLAANEAYIFDAASGACLAIDFSPLRDGEEAPRRKTLAASARLAGESLESEEGTSDVHHDSRKAEITGAEMAYRVDAEFRHHGESLQFVGIIGFHSPYWFYLYYTDPLRDPADRLELEQILRSMALLPDAD